MVFFAEQLNDLSLGIAESLHLPIVQIVENGAQVSSGSHLKFGEPSFTSISQAQQTTAAVAWVAHRRDEAFCDKTSDDTRKVSFIQPKPVGNVGGCQSKRRSVDSLVCALARSVASVSDFVKDTRLGQRIWAFRKGLIQEPELARVKSIEAADLLHQKLAIMHRNPPPLVALPNPVLP